MHMWHDYFDRLIIGISFLVMSIKTIPRILSQSCDSFVYSKSHDVVNVLLDFCVSLTLIIKLKSNEI